MIVDVLPNRTDMICCLLRERERLANQSATALPQRVVETLNMAGLTAFLTTRSMPLGRKNSVIGLPEIGVADRTLPIKCRKRGPKLVCFRFRSRSNRQSDNLARLAVEC